MSERIYFQHAEQLPEEDVSVYSPGVMEEAKQFLDERDLEAYLEKRSNTPDAEWQDSLAEDGEEKYEDMSISQLANKLGEAMYYGDKTTDINISEVLLGKVSDLVEQNKKGGKDTEHNELRESQILDRVIGIAQRRVETLKQELRPGEEGRVDTQDIDIARDLAYEENEKYDNLEHNKDVAYDKALAEDQDRTLPAKDDEAMLDEAYAEDQDRTLPAKDDEAMLDEAYAENKRRSKGRLRRAFKRARYEAAMLVANPKEYFKDDEMGKRRKAVAAVAGAAVVGLAAFVAYKYGADSGGHETSVNDIADNTNTVGNKTSATGDVLNSSIDPVENQSADPFAEVAEKGLGTIETGTPNGLVRGALESLRDQGFDVSGLTPDAVDKIAADMQEQGIKVQFGMAENGPHIVDLSDSELWSKGLTENYTASGEAALPEGSIRKFVEIARENGVRIRPR